MLQRLRVLHLTAPAESGGLETVVSTLATEQHRCGQAVRVLAVIEPRSGAHPFVTALRSVGVDAVQVELPGRAYLAERRLVRGMIDDWRPDVVHTHGHRSDVLHVGPARARGAAVVSTEHGFSPLGARVRLYRALQQALLRRFDAVVAVSRPIHQKLAGTWVTAPRLHLIPNAWNGVRPSQDRGASRRKLGLPQEGFIAGWIGRMVPVKGGDVFLAAMADPRLIDVKACLIGSGPERGRLERIAASSRPGDVFFPGAVAPAAELFPAFDVFVLSSRSEGTPMTLFEAMAARVPIVAAAVGGVPDVLSGEEASLVPPDDPEALAGAIEAVAADAAAAASRAAAAERRLEDEFGIAPWVRKYDVVYREAIRSARRRAAGRGASAAA